ncbi:MAG: DotA/TraY family protein [Alphaproteobacteria bacterium]
MAILSKTSFVQYMVLPGFLPRIGELFGSGFSFIAGLLAVIYRNIGLLPRGHVYLDPNNIGRFGVRHVIAEAGRNLVYSRKHIDQVILYYTILIGIALFVLQFVLLGISLVSGSAMASSLWQTMFGTTPTVHRPGGNPSQDMAFFVLDSVFGVRVNSGGSGTMGFFESCVGDVGVLCEDIRGNALATQPAWPKPMHTALHAMLHFYTLGIAMISGVVLLYFIVAIVGETITTGTPFGQRFNRAWFIPRLIVFFALLAPISISGNNAGINVGQLITFSVAKYGSNLATNAWLNFVDTGTSAVANLMSQEKRLLASPNVPEVAGLSQFMHVVRVCMYAEKVINGIDVYPYLVRENASNKTYNVRMHDGTTEQYNQMGGTAADHLDFFSTDFQTAIKFARYGSVIIRFGHRDPPGGLVTDPNNPPGAYEKEWANVESTCGELHIDITSLDPHVIGGPSLPANIYGVQENYYYTLTEMLQFDTWADQTSFCMIRAILPYDNKNDCVGNTLGYVVGPTAIGRTQGTEWLTAQGARDNIETYHMTNKFYLGGEDISYNGGYSYSQADDPFSAVNFDYESAAYVNNLLLSDEVKERGWAGAALWYNKIAEINGIMGSAMQNIPRPFKYPKVMEEIAQQHRASDSNVSYADRFNPRLQNGKLATLPRPGDQYIAAALYSSYSFWRSAGVQETVFTRRANNSFIDVINMILGTHGLYDIYENVGIHPLAMLSAMGKSMVDAALRNLFGGLIGQGIGELLSDEFIGKLADTASSFAFRFGMMGLSVGFVLYYVLPLMPFIYFFFAFSGWIKSIFEAVVAMPLWAIAHVRVDGEGLPGPLATNGYFLLFEIFLRPSLIIFGFVASISLFAALVDGLHNTFGLITTVASGYDLEAEIQAPLALIGNDTTSKHWKGPVDEFFYTILYTIIVYMIGLSCFKLVDQIPNNIMRWMGVTVSTFHEVAGDPAADIAGKMYRASQLTNAQVLDMISRMRGEKSNNLLNTQMQTMGTSS